VDISMAKSKPTEDLFLQNSYPLLSFRCILRWITRSKGPKAVCPHCKYEDINDKLTLDWHAYTTFTITRHPIKVSDIRAVLPIKLGAIDTAQIERFKSEVASTKAAIVERRYQLEKALLALSMSRRELEKRKARIQLAKDRYE
jgi:uncharacterized protein YpbB